MKYLIDTGADVSMIPPPHGVRRRLPLPSQLFAANGNVISTYDLAKASPDSGTGRGHSETAVTTPFGLFEFTHAFWTFEGISAAAFEEVQRSCRCPQSYTPPHGRCITCHCSRCIGFGGRCGTPLQRVATARLLLEDSLQHSGGIARMTESCWQTSWPLNTSGFMVEGRSFITLFTDHKPLWCSMHFNAKEDKRTPQQLRHLDLIDQFTTDIRYLKGSENVVAYASSRIHISTINAPSVFDFSKMAREQQRIPNCRIFYLVPVQLP
ncbi:retrovirus-related Pol polyprotein from transposon 17.6 [Trichonephila clavipes]|nr:retrovirus-related Pol polyprotein from transposon 17.6 [Trichonephila clavipes]